MTALGSWLQARSRGGEWRVRIDDLDGPRCVPGAEAEILRQLRDHGLHWDGAPVRQSAHRAQYGAALERLAAGGGTYRCACTRRQLAQSRRSGPDGPVYPGTCRSAGHATGALRVALGPGPVRLEEAGQWLERPVGDIGDPVVQRADGTPGYALASVVDEHLLGITEVVRGGDLRGASFQQQALRSPLGLAALPHRHLPVLADSHGRKLSKQNHAPAVDAAGAAANLRRCLGFLGQDPGPAGLDSAAELLAWAVAHWEPQRLPGPGPRAV